MVATLLVPNSTTAGTPLELIIKPYGRDFSVGEETILMLPVFGSRRPTMLAFCAVNGAAAQRLMMLMYRWPTAAGRSDHGRVSFTVITYLLTFRMPLGSIMSMLPRAAFSLFAGSRMRLKV